VDENTILLFQKFARSTVGDVYTQGSEEIKTAKQNIVSTDKSVFYFN
jgi:hypothetical protein